jgi:hypothetical protein
MKIDKYFLYFEFFVKLSVLLHAMGCVRLEARKPASRYTVVMQGVKERPWELL